MKDPNAQFMRMQTQWAQTLDSVLKNPIIQSNILQSVSLVSGDNVINTLLGRKLQGWFLSRRRGSATIYDKQDSNQTPQLTLVLNSSAPVVVDLVVF